MSNDDVNAVVLRLARTLQRCGEDPRVVFSALIGAAATLGPDIGQEMATASDMRRAVESVMAFGDLRGLGEEPSRPAGVVVPFRAQVA